MTPKAIGLSGFDGVTALHLVGPAEAFSAAALDDGYGGRIPCYNVTTVAVGAERIQTESGFTLTTARWTMRRSSTRSSWQAAPAFARAGVNDALVPWLLERAPAAQRLGRICSGIYGLAPTGLLNGRNVTTHWRHAREVATRFPQLKVDHKKALVQDGRFFTSSGLSAGLNLSLAMIQEDYGPFVARAVERELFLRLFRSGGGDADWRGPHGHTTDRSFRRSRRLDDSQSAERSFGGSAGTPRLHVSESFQQNVQERLRKAADRLRGRAALE